MSFFVETNVILYLLDSLVSIPCSIESVVRITGITAYMLVRCPLLGACALSIVPFVAVVNKKYGDWLRKNAIAVQTALAQANSVAQEAISCVRTVVAFAAEKFEYEKYTDKIDVQYRLNVRQLFMTGVYYMAISTFLINTCVQAALLLIGTALIEHGRLTPEVLLAFMLYQGQLQVRTQLKHFLRLRYCRNITLHLS